jgi:hypothetical protein
MKKRRKVYKMTKKIIVIVMAALLITFIGYGSSTAGNGTGAGDGEGPIHDIYSGIPFDYEGVVVEMLPGQGLKLGTADGESIAVYGIGPVSYWEEINVERPAVGERIIVAGYTVNYEGIERNIATVITIYEEEVPLRDLETGIPLWR